MTHIAFTRFSSSTFIFLLLFAVVACNAENDHWIVVNILNQSRTSETVPDTADVCNCASPEQKTVSCSAGTTKDLSVQVGMPINWALVQIDPSVAASIGLNKTSGESLELPIPPKGYCVHYDLVTQYEIVKGQAQVRSATSGQEAKPEFTFHATCKKSIVSTRTVLCPVVPTSGSANPSRRPTAPTDAPPVVPSTQVYQVQVSAKSGWVNSGITVMAGQAIQMSASGQWSNGSYSDGTRVFTPSYGPDGGNALESKYNYPLRGNGVLVGTLIGKIGSNGAPFRVGSNFPTNVANSSGILYFAMNDDPSSLDDNQGFVTVVVTVSPSR